MTVSELMEKIGAVSLTGEAGLEGEVTCGYSCDLLSWVMAHGTPGMAWITVQTHMNVIAVATLLEMRCVIVPEGIKVEEAVLEKAREEGVCVLGSDKSAFALCGLMWSAGLPAV